MIALMLYSGLVGFILCAGIGYIVQAPSYENLLREVACGLLGFFFVVVAVFLILIVAVGGVNYGGTFAGGV